MDAEKAPNPVDVGTLSNRRAPEPTDESFEPDRESDVELASKHTQLDTWRGWTVVAAASLSLFAYMGVLYSWGILQAELAATSSFSLMSLTFIGSLAASFMCSLCIVSGKFLRRFGHQRTAIVGAVFLGMGEFLSSWATHRLPALYITHGLIFGIGGSCTILACSTAPLPWFQKHRGLATGVVFGGGSLGAAVMGVVTNGLVQKLGVEWAFRILGFILWAVCLPAACLIKQPEGPQSAVPTLQWGRWRDADFLILLIGSSLACFPLFIPPYFIPIFARAVSDSGNTTVIALTIWNIASTVGRVFAGYTADSFLGPINSLIVSLFLCGTSALAIWPFASSVGLLAFFAVINGIGCGSFFSLFPTVVGAVFGPENTMAVLPIMWTGWFFGFFLGSPIASFLYAMAGSSKDVSLYRPAAYYAGATSVVGMVFMLFIRSMRAKEVFKRV